MEKLTKFQKLFYLTYSHPYIIKGEKYPSGILMLIDFITIPLNYPVLLITGWSRRLV